MKGNKIDIPLGVDKPNEMELTRNILTRIGKRRVCVGQNDINRHYFSLSHARVEEFLQ